MNFRVWAPRPTTVDLLIHDRRIAATPAGGGWWSVTVTAARPGDRYAWSLDGGPPRPDPRSRDQPDGVHEASRIVDHDAYAWRHRHFRPPALAAAVLYELHVGTFTPDGTLDAAAERLEHLVDLGVTHVSLMPLNAFDGERGWGYDGVAWFAPHRPFTGPDGPDAVKRFVDACHGHGLAVIADVVWNHLGPSGNYLGEFGPYFTDAYHTPWGAAMNLDGPGSDEVRRLMIDNGLAWLRDYRFDGLRIDAVHAFHDRSAVHVLEQLRRAVDRFEAATGRRVDLIAESDLNDPRVVRDPEAGGLGMDAQWSDDFHHALHARLTGERTGYYADFGAVADLAKAWRTAFVIDGTHAAHRGRRHGRPPVGLDGGRFLAYAQTHDQVGNRARGERLSHLVPAPAVPLAAALVLLSPFVPMLFQGEEWAASSPFQYFTDHHDPELAAAVRAGRRREFAAFVDDPERIPDPQAYETFRRSQLDWDERRSGRHATVLDWHRRLIRFRREHAELAPGPLGETATTWSEEPPWLRVDRRGLTLLFNLGPDPVAIPLGAPGLDTAADDAAAAGDATAADTAAAAAIPVPAPPSVLLTNDPRFGIEAARARLTGFGVAVLRLAGAGLPRA